MEGIDQNHAKRDFAPQGAARPVGAAPSKTPVAFCRTLWSLQRSTFSAITKAPNRGLLLWEGDCLTSRPSNCLPTNLFHASRIILIILLTIGLDLGLRYRIVLDKVKARNHKMLKIYFERPAKKRRGYEQNNNNNKPVIILVLRLGLYKQTRSLQRNTRQNNPCLSTSR